MAQKRSWERAWWRQGGGRTASVGGSRDEPTEKAGELNWWEAGETGWRGDVLCASRGPAGQA
eukprot:1190746-Heterocapsa_arctica.AAC.1